jgi:hypothetical protein
MAEGIDRGGYRFKCPTVLLTAKSAAPGRGRLSEGPLNGGCASGIKPGQYGWSFDELVASWQRAEEFGFGVLACFDRDGNSQVDQRVTSTSGNRPSG